jgi:hypothetical protein
MLSDILNWAGGSQPTKLITKETLNHPGLIELVSGLDVYTHTPEAYRRAYQALGIDLVNRVPLENAPTSTPAGETRRHPKQSYDYAHLGVYDTLMRHTYACAALEDVWDLDPAKLEYEDLLTPVPHPCQAADARSRQAFLGNFGLYYPMLYTTLFMWAVEVLGWEIFLLAAALEPRRFHDHFLAPCAKKSRMLVAELVRYDSPFVFVHDDLASASGPVFRPSWYDDFIFPHYPEIFAPAKQAGKKIILVADGNMTRLLPRLVDAGVDGLMFESPATPLEAVIEHFGALGQFFIGGISTIALTFGSPSEVREIVFQVIKQAGSRPGFALASGGGLHGSLPMNNLEAYFDARAETGATPGDWRRCCA